jgi:hypothetical protein
MSDHIKRVNDKICEFLSLMPLHSLRTKDNNMFWNTTESLESRKKYVLEYEKKDKRIEFSILEWQTRKEVLKIELQPGNNPLNLNQILYLREYL